MWVFEKNHRAVVAEFKVDFFLVGINLHVQVFIEVAVAIPIVARLAIVRSHGGADFVHFQKPPNQLVASVDLQHAIGTRPILNFSAEFVLLLLSASGQANRQGHAAQEKAFFQPSCGCLDHWKSVVYRKVNFLLC